MRKDKRCNQTSPPSPYHKAEANAIRGKRQTTITQKNGDESRAKRKNKNNRTEQTNNSSVLFVKHTKIPKQMIIIAHFDLFYELDSRNGYN